MDFYRRIYHFIPVFSKSVESDEWQNVFDQISIPYFIVDGAEEIELYLQVTPGTANYNLDNVTFEIINDENWEEEANERIEILRKRDVTIYLDFDGINENDLIIEIEQKNHQFPFGTAVRSQNIADCLDNEESLDKNNVENQRYCNFINDNFNWMVDNFR